MLALGIGLVAVHFFVMGIPHAGKEEVSELIRLGRGRIRLDRHEQRGRAREDHDDLYEVSDSAPPVLQDAPPVAPTPLPQLRASSRVSAPKAQQSSAEEGYLAALRAWEASDENNAKFPGPRPGDTEERSAVADVLPGKGPGHEHGLLGRNSDGTERTPPTPLPSRSMTNEERRDANRGFCFNSRVSDSISLDRAQADYRSAACRNKAKSYPKDLPTATVVIVFHNENFSILVRSIHSVLNHSPSHLLREVIVVDDASAPDPERFYERHWKRLQDELRDHLMMLPKVTLVRLVERRGLMVARMEGIWRATSDVTVFLDSHIEATPGYLEAMLARIKETGGKSVVVPSIDSIGSEDFSYRAGGGLGVLGFSWTLGQMPTWADNGPDGSRPARSPVMAGGLLASDRKMFLKLGGYDPEMRLYGGEEMEIGFRTWMCGGAIEYVPCSHVGHVFRTPAYWQGQVYRVPGEEIARNKLRTALVWMDDYAKLVEFATAPLPESLPMGDLGPRKRLREKLQCKDFTWYMRHVVPSMFAPRLTKEAKGGCLQNKVKDGCLDTLGQSGDGAEMGVYPCHFQHGTQSLVLDADGLVRLPGTGYEECMTLDRSDVVRLKRCGNEDEQRWVYDEESQEFKSRSTNGCLTFVDKPSAKSPFSLAVEACHSGTPEQSWTWGH